MSIPFVLCAVLTLRAQQPKNQPQQPAGPTPEEIRILQEQEQRREAEERQRLDRELQRLEDLDGRRHLPLSPEEIEARRRKRLPQFKKDLEAFRSTSAQISSYTTAPVLDSKSVKDVRKQAKALEGYIDDIVDYLMDGEEPPEPVTSDSATATLEARISLLKPLTLSMHQRIKTSFFSPLVDANVEIDLIQDLQNVKFLVHSLRK